MKRTEAVRRLSAYADAIRALGATSLYIFGSIARDDADDQSDIDLFIDYESNGKFSLLDLVDIKLLLESELGIPVDLTTRNSLNPMLKEEIEKSAVRVF